MSHLVVMAAGTGGHIMPGLAVAREMQGRGWSVSWLGTSHGMENQLVPPAQIPLDTNRPYEAGIVSLAARSFGVDYSILSLIVLTVMLVLPACQ